MSLVTKQGDPFYSLPADSTFETRVSKLTFVPLNKVMAAIFRITTRPPPYSNPLPQATDHVTENKQYAKIKIISLTLGQKTIKVNLALLVLFDSSG